MGLGQDSERAPRRLESLQEVSGNSDFTGKLTLRRAWGWQNERCESNVC